MVEDPNTSGLAQVASDVTTNILGNVTDLNTEEEVDQPQIDNTDEAENNGATTSILEQLRANPPPDALPAGWVVRKSHTYPDYVYYYHQETGECRWETPLERSLASAAEIGAAAAAAVASQQQQQQTKSKPAVRGILKKSLDAAAAATAQSTASSSDGSRKRSRDENGGGGRPSKMPDSASSAAASGASDGQPPKEVRVLHLLKKHRGSRRPASWRNPKITDSKEKAMSDLKELISILKESQDDPKELRATFEELARTESDCSSAKRGGDLGFFGRKKMQPAFEKASFALKIGELSNIVETSSGVHVILRLA